MHWQALSAAGSNGAFGEAVAGGLQLQARLVRSSRHARSPDFHLMPCPRGALSNLKATPQDSSLPGAGEIKVHAHSVCRKLQEHAP